MSILSSQRLAGGLAKAVKRLGQASDRLAAEGQEAQAKALKTWLDKAGCAVGQPGWHGALAQGGDATVPRVLGEMRDTFDRTPELREALRQAGGRAPRTPQQPLPPLLPKPAPVAAQASELAPENVETLRGIVGPTPPSDAVLGHRKRPVTNKAGEFGLEIRAGDLARERAARDASAGYVPKGLSGATIGHHQNLTVTAPNLAGEDLARFDLNHTTFVKGQLKGANMEGAFLHRANLEGADLTWANLQEARLRQANLKGAKLEAAVAAQADFRGANMKGADLHDVNAYGAQLQGANLTDARLSLGNLDGANLERANLQGADLHGAFMPDTKLRGANLRGADLERVDLTGADLRGAYLHGAHVPGADLRGADMTSATLDFADLTRADLSGTKLPDLRQATIKGATVVNPHSGREIKLRNFWDLPSQQRKAAGQQGT
jgi:uncharacterized protein YjbI with pentapeptide repeats